MHKMLPEIMVTTLKVNGNLCISLKRFKTLLHHNYKNKTKKHLHIPYYTSEDICTACADLEHNNKLLNAKALLSNHIHELVGFHVTFKPSSKLSDDGIRPMIVSDCIIIERIK